MTVLQVRGPAVRLRAEVQRVLADQEVRVLRADASGVETLGTDLLRELLAADVVLRRRGGGLLLEGCSPRVMRVIAGAGLRDRWVSPERFALAA